MNWLKELIFGAPNNSNNNNQNINHNANRHPIQLIQGTDLVVFAGTECCPICSMYNHRVLSISGKDKRFPPLSFLPNALHDGKCDLCKRDYGLYSWYEGTSSPDVKTAIQISNAPLVDRRTPAQKSFFYSMQNNFKNININQNTSRHPLRDVRHSDLAVFNGSSCCPICSMYNRRVFSISGKDKRFPPLSSLPNALHDGKCDLCGCYYGLSAYFEGISSTDVKTAIQISHMPLIDKRTPEQKQHFYEKQTKAKNKKKKP